MEETSPGTAASVLDPGQGNRRILAPSGRLEAFSDGVFGITMTLLVLDVHVPSQSEVQASGSLLRALLHMWPSYLSYLAAFLNVGVIWLNHHAVFVKIAKVDRGLLWWNLVLLLTVSFTPFPNALVADYLHAGLLDPSARTATAVYGLVFTASTIPWIFSWSHVLHNPALMEPGWGEDYPRRERRRAGFGVVVYSGCVAVAAFVPLVAVLMFLGLAVFYGVTSDGLRSVPFRLGAGGGSR